jgi:putative peptidoglycan lipid II flippase
MHRPLARATALMTFGTLLSRATGLLRIAAMTAALGIVESGRLTDTYNLANTAPNIIYELVLGGVLTSVFVPVFVELLEKEGRERTWQVASAVINVALVLLTAVTALGIAAAPWIARLYASRLEGQAAELQHDILTFLLRLFIPQIIFYGLAAITAGLLQAHRRFGAPMYTPVLNNLTVIAAFLVFRHFYERVTFEGVTTSQLLVIGIGTTAGVALMALAQLPFLRGLGRYRLTFALGHPSVKKLARLSVYVIGYVITNVLGYLIVQYLANAQQGGYSAYVAAFTFFMLPHGLFAVSVITALLPGMSQHAANHDLGALRERLSTGVRATFLLILPAAVGLFVLGEPIIRFLLENGVMSPTSTELVASVLRYFVIGLVPFSLYQFFRQTFNALQDTKTPFLINCASVALNTAVNIPMFAWLGVEGLAAGHAIAYTFGVAVQAWLLRRRIGGLDGTRVVRSAARIAGAAAGMGLLVWAVSAAGQGMLDPAGPLGDLALVVLTVGTGISGYLALAHLLRVEELGFVWALVRRRAAGSTPEGPQPI